MVPAKLQVEIIKITTGQIANIYPAFLSKYIFSFARAPMESARSPHLINTPASSSHVSYQVL
jgi:hypothetical protein